MSNHKIHKVGIIMNGVTGRMGTNQHLMRSILPIIEQGGVRIDENERIMPNPILVGRNSDKLQKLSTTSQVEKWTTDLDSVLDDSNYPVYFDAQATNCRFTAVLKAIEAGKHIYCEKPSADNATDAKTLYELAKMVGAKNGVVQDKLWLPGIVKLRRLLESEFFGRILSVRGEFGYWVFEGETIPAQRPSWNYRKEDGGSIVLDMFPHWCYLLHNLFGRIEALSCLAATHIPERVDEHGKSYACTADDSAYATFQLEGGVIAQFNSSWSVRVRRDDLLTLQVDGTKGSAVAGLRNCVSQSYDETPRAVWNPDLDRPNNFFDDWTKAPNEEEHDNAFKIQWQLFLRHIVLNEPFKWNLLEGAKGVRLAEIALQSWAERRWLEVPEMTDDESFE